MEKINVSSKIKIDSVDEYILVEKIFFEKDGSRNASQKVTDFLELKRSGNFNHFLYWFYM